MQIVTTHLSADFDAFSACVCALRLYPGHQVLFPGSQEAAVRRFLAEVDTPFPEVRLRVVRRERLDNVVVVDTRTPRRLGEVWQLIQRDRCPITLIDHHVTEMDKLGSQEMIEREVGATCTIIAQLFQEKGLTPTPEEASLLLMGMYEDTGGLSYRETTPDDLRIAAWLLENGGSLEWVRRWVLKGLVPEQLELLNRITEATENVSLSDVDVSVAMLEVDRYYEEAAYVVHRWVDTFDIPVGVVLLVQPPHVNVILRSRLEGLHVGRVAQEFNGGGHATAASARVSNRMPVEVREQLLEVLNREMPPPVAAADIATSSIFSIASDETVEATKELINQRRINALPVRDAEGDKLVGLVTRQILDRAVSHGLSDRPVKTVMQPDLPCVAAETSLTQLRDLFLERSHRFVVVTRDERPLGLVTRMDLFRRLFERQYSTGAPLDHRMAGRRPVSQSITRLLRDTTPVWVSKLLKTAKAVADTVGIPVYLVGGMVRDLLLARPNEDVDLVVEGSGIDFGYALAGFTGGRCHPHQPFLTAVVTLPDGHRVDVVSARTEFYRTPAALPEVATSLIRQDLYRRDFTINALAVVLHGERHGQLVDFFGGRMDLQKREIRVLHSLSFIDDPTRAIRAVRYARRLEFSVAPDTRNLIETAIQERVFDELSGQRLRRELRQLLEEPHPTQALALLAELGLVPAICSALEWSEELHTFLLKLEGQVAWFELERLGDPPPAWLLFLGAVALHSGDSATEALADRLQLTGSLRERLNDLREHVDKAKLSIEDGLKRSKRVQSIESLNTEATLIAMAELDLESRRALADAMVASVRVVPGVSGRQLVNAGVAPGPSIGEAIRVTRDALVDGTIDQHQAFEFALEAAKNSVDDQHQ
ncbi:MAG: CBS domain-containing protein [bacterium]|nr:CBS domain-containing protein [bacterium]